MQDGAVAALGLFHPCVRDWFVGAFGAPTRAQVLGWPPIARGESALILAPTGSGKTLAAFLWCLHRLGFGEAPPRGERCRVVYVSPLKALAVDVERNLRAPLAGIAALAASRGERHRLPAIAVRTGDTPPRERARFGRAPADVLITTPESLYLLLTSEAREALRAVDTVIVDEIHALVPTKRGAHLMLSLERLAALTGRPLQRLGLSATQRPLEEVARFLGGTDGPDGSPRPVTVVDASTPKALTLTVEVPVEDMTRPGRTPELASSPGAAPASIWSAIHGRLLELIRSHRSTLIFANSRRVAERLAGALNELAGETLVLAHHGSIALAQRAEIEERLKAGDVRALVATSSLELGIDMGAIDLVVQIEAPPSVASGLQRVGRAGHSVGATSAGVIFPKFRGDLVASAALTRLMGEGQVELTRYPRNPLDVLAQQVVAMAAMDRWEVETLLATVRRAAPYATISMATFEGVLDMLAGRYPSDDFAELRPRITWDRVAGTVRAREGARRVAVVNGGTIPDRGLYGVYLAGARPGTGRVGELDEEMVFESRVGETFLLGASSWRIEEITHDRVLVSPAPGVPGKMPFWRGEAPGRPLETGRAIGRLVRNLGEIPGPAACARLESRHGLTPQAAEHLLRYLADQAAAGATPDDRTVVVERTRDELGDWRVCVLAPFGGRVLAPWAMAAVARVRAETGLDVETMWTDDGFVVRFPETDAPPDAARLIPGAAGVESLVLDEVAGTALFAARFREAAARALLLPRRRPGGRTPLWQQRKRAGDLLAVAARHASFPIVLETYRECLRDAFDVPALRSLLEEIEEGTVRVVTLDSATPSPFAASLLFGYVANYLYDGDAPLAERRAQALAIDHAQLRELLGEAELRRLLDAGAIQAVEERLQHLDPSLRARSADAVHDLLLRLGDLSGEALGGRCASPEVARSVATLARERRVLEVVVAGERRWIAVEHASRYRDALGVSLPPGVPEAFLAAVADPLGDLVHRHARTHGPFTTREAAGRYGLAAERAEETLRRLLGAGRLLQGEFRPGGHGPEWCDPDVLQAVRRRSLARLRREVEPVEPAALARLVTTWQGVTRPRRGLDPLLDAIEQLQGAALPASLLEREILPARIAAYQPGDLDALAAAGEVVWCGLEALGERDGRIALYLADALPRLRRPVEPAAALQGLAARVVAHLQAHGASFFTDLHRGLGGFPRDLVEALWDLVWKGVVTNDAFHALRDYTARPGHAARRGRVTARAFRSRRTTPSSAEGRWGLLAPLAGTAPSPTEWAVNAARQLLTRHGVVTRETLDVEGIPGGWTPVYEALKAMEDAGRVRRGYFATGVGAAQFALPEALEQLRGLREEPERPEVVRLAALDPANPYGAVLRWPETAGAPGRGPSRSVGSTVILVNGRCAAWIARGGRALWTWLPDDAVVGPRTAQALARELAAVAFEGGRRGGLLLAEIDGGEPAAHPVLPWLREVGFTLSAAGLALPRSHLARA